MGLKPRVVLPSFPLRPGARLRPFRRSDRDELFRVVDADRQRLRAWMPWLDFAADPSGIAGFLAETSRMHVAGIAVRMAIEVGGAICGTASLENVSALHRSASIGYWIARTHEGRGLITRAVRALCDYGFGQRDLHRIEIRAAPDNWRSRRVPERLGFRTEGRVREVEWLYDHYVDHVVYGMLAAEWRDLRAGRFKD